MTVPVGTGPLDPAGRRWRAIGTWCEVLVRAPGLGATELDRLADDAVTYAIGVVVELDAACSRFRPDSELLRLAHGTVVGVSETLDGALGAALRTARATGGLVDPTVGTAVRATGYDDDFDAVRVRADGPDEKPPVAAPGHWRIHHDPAHRDVLVPHRVELDLGASAKAWAADRIAGRLVADLLPSGGGALVNLGGDLAVCGAAPAGGWRIRVDDGNPGPVTAGQPVVAIRSGGLATSSTALRTWRQGGELRHHIVDPRTGRTAPDTWRTVTVAARSCELANAAATAAVVLGRDAPGWLRGHGVHAWLRRNDGSVLTVGDWPESPAAGADRC